MKKKEKTPMQQLTKGYEKFIAGKNQSQEGKKLFGKAIKKAAKSRGSK